MYDNSYCPTLVSAAFLDYDYTGVSHAACRTPVLKIVSPGQHVSFSVTKWRFATVSERVSHPRNQLHYNAQLKSIKNISYFIYTYIIELVYVLRA